MKSAITIALVPEISKGPWVYWQNLETGMQKAAELGFDAVELFTSSGTAFDTTVVQQLCKKYNLQVCAVGTGAGKVVQGLTLTDPDPSVRAKAIAFIERMIEFGGALGAPAIIGSMQGNIPVGEQRSSTEEWLAEGLQILSEQASQYTVPLIYEPLNRYETNLFNELGAAADFLGKKNLGKVKLLADLFHMNIEETAIDTAIRQYGCFVGHVHFADSNRRAMGLGHTDMTAIAKALKDIQYRGYLSAEIFPLPDADTAALQTIRSFKNWFCEK